MAKRMVGFTIAITMCMSLYIPSAYATPNMADHQSSSIISEASNIIGVALNEGIVPGQADNEISGLYLAEDIPIYEVTSNNNLTAIDSMMYYPVVDQSNRVCGIIIARSEGTDGTYTLEYSPMFSDELNSYEQSSSEICFIFDQTNIFVYDGSTYSTILQDNIPDLSRGFLNSLDIETEQISLSAIEAHDPLYLSVTHDPSESGMLSVPIVEQAGWKNGCWAASSVSVGEYCGPSRGLTVDDIMEKYADGEDKTEFFYTVRTILSNEYDIETNIHPFVTLTLTEIMENIGSGRNNGTPIVARTSYSFNSGHIFVVCGYTAAPEPQTSYVTIMDPLADSYRILEMEKSGGDSEFKYHTPSGNTLHIIDDYLTIA